VNLFLRMSDVQVALGILIHCFMQRPSYLLWCASPTSTFIKSFILLLFFFHKMFGRLLGLRSFDISKGPLVHKQTSLPITFDGVGLVLTSIITPTTYLRNWAFVISIIFARFMVDQCPFLLEALVGVDNNTFPFQQHLNNTCDLLTPPTRACLFPFEQFIGQ
jgi:hypothetical protein